MPPSRPRALSGIQPTGAGFHLGNYLGAVRAWAQMQDSHEVFWFLADMHALTVPHDPATLRRRTREAAAELLAMGVDPARASLFAQSHVPEHAELAWVLSCLTGYGEASRMTQFKEKAARKELGAASVGLFTYPVLQAADILLYQADAVPVGDDQRQHLELTRDLAQRFNSRFGETFVVPTAYVPAQAARIADLAEPTRKMSKSAPVAGTLYLLDDEKLLVKKIRSAVTDTGREIVATPDKPGVTNLLTVASVLRGQSVGDLEAEFSGRGYGELKAAVAEAVLDLVRPLQQRYAAFLDDPSGLDDILAAGAERAGAVARATMAQVRERIGFLAARTR